MVIPIPKAASVSDYYTTVDSNFGHIPRGTLPLQVFKQVTYYPKGSTYEIFNISNYDPT